MHALHQAGATRTTMPNIGIGRRLPASCSLWQTPGCLPPLDFEITFEIGAIFDKDSRRNEIADHNRVFLDLNSVTRPKIPEELAIHDNLARYHFRSHLTRLSYR